MFPCRSGLRIKRTMKLAHKALTSINSHIFSRTTAHSIVPLSYSASQSVMYLIVPFTMGLGSNSCPEEVSLLRASELCSGVRVRCGLNMIGMTISVRMTSGIGDILRVCKISGLKERTANK